MYGFKFWFKVLWPGLLIPVFSLVGTVCFIVVCINAEHKNKEEMRTAPCESFADRPIEHIPARCIPYFKETDK